MDIFSQGINICAAFLPVNRKLMVLQRNENLIDGMKWELPGGKLEQNESFEEAIKRECKEELSIDINPIEEVGSVELTQGDVVSMFMFILISGDVSKIKLKDHREIRYVTFNELKNLDLSQADRLFVQNYGSEIKKLID